MDPTGLRRQAEAERASAQSYEEAMTREQSRAAADIAADQRQIDSIKHDLATRTRIAQDQVSALERAIETRNATLSAQLTTLQHQIDNASAEAERLEADAKSRENEIERERERLAAALVTNQILDNNEQR